MKTFLICYNFEDDKYLNYLSEMIDADNIEGAIYKMRCSRLAPLHIISAQELHNYGKKKSQE